MLHHIQKTLITSASKSCRTRTTSIFGKLSVIAAAGMAASTVQAAKLSESASAYVPANQVNSWFDDRAELRFLALQNYQAFL